MISSVASSWELAPSSLATDIRDGLTLPKPEGQKQNQSHSQSLDQDQDRHTGFCITEDFTTTALIFHCVSPKQKRLVLCEVIIILLIFSEITDQRLLIRLMEVN